MRFVVSLLTIIALLGTFGCNNASEGSSGSAAGDAVMKEAPKSTTKDPDMPQPGGGMDRSEGVKR